MRPVQIIIAFFIVIVLTAGISYFYFNRIAPDLVIVKVQEIPKNQYASDYIVTIQNNGSGDVKQAFSICMWDDRYAPPSGPPCNNGKLTNYDSEKMAPATLEAGASVEVTFESISAINPGQKLYFVADRSNDRGDNSVLESEETNNLYILVKQ